MISPLLSNIYLHTVLDDWFVKDIQPHIKGKSFMVRFADDFVMGFANKSDAESMLEALKARFAAYGVASPSAENATGAVQKTAA